MAIAFDVDGVGAESDVVVYVSEVEDEGVKGELEFGTDSDQCAGDGLEDAVPFELDCQQLGLFVRLTPPK